MKSLVARILVIGTALAGVVAVNAADKTITANVPFNFYMGPSVMPPGAYRVDELANGGIVALRTSHSAKAIVTFPVSGKSESEPPGWCSAATAKPIFWPRSGQRTAPLGML